MMNKKGSNWWAWFFIIIFIFIITSAIRHSMIRDSMYNDITGNIINERDSEEPQTQQEQVTKQQEIYPSRQKQITQITDYEQTQNQNQEESKETQESTPPSCQSGYMTEYRCDGNNIQQKYQYKNCNVEWIKVELCEYGCSDGKCNSEPQITAVTVSYVSDGDTFKLSTGETIRLIGLNAPESGQSCSSEATAKLKEFVLGKEVTLEQDVSDKDQYGRLLRYVYVDGTFVNLEMVRLGLAHKYEYGSNTKYSSQFEQAEDEAKQNEGCLWKTSQEDYITDQCIYITNFHFNAAGDDNYNSNDEYVIFGNKCSYSIEMTGWTIKDETASHIYLIPSFTFQSGATFTLYTGTGTNTNSALYWGRTSGDYAAIWNNGGDTLFLTDFDGNLVLSQSYFGY